MQPPDAPAGPGGIVTPRALHWDQGLVLLDQTRLPGETVEIRCTTVDQVVDAVQRLAVRGAPALGAVGALGVVVAIQQSERDGWSAEVLDANIRRIRDARPTAVNLAWGVDQVAPLVSDGWPAVLDAALRIVAEDEAANRELSRLGADWAMARIGARPIRVLTHCNTGFLATTAWGTALGIVRELNNRGGLDLVYVDETRPLLQGARLTAWELGLEGIKHCIQVDGAAASTIMRGLVDLAVIGADRIARNGDTANKIGSLGVALACREFGVPFVVAAPFSTVDLQAPDGGAIEIELRSEDEVTALGGQRIAPIGSTGFNPAFDVTPARFIDAICTERGVVEPDGSADLLIGLGP